MIGKIVMCGYQERGLSSDVIGEIKTHVSYSSCIIETLVLVRSLNRSGWMMAFS